jgi:hypothetical protein
MKTNILSLSFRQEAATDQSPACLVGELRIDGQIVGGGYVVDVRELAMALTREGEHFIFTCGCGEPGCAGIHEGFHTWLEGEVISVEGNLPKGVACSWKLSAAQAKKVVAEALRAVEPLASSMEGEHGYPIGPDGRMDGETLRHVIASLS